MFGAGWLPKAARNLGKAKVELRFAAQQQFNEAKQQVVEATGIEQVEAKVRKANKASSSTSPQGLLKSAAASAITPKAVDTAKAAETTESDESSS